MSKKIGAEGQKMSLGLKGECPSCSRHFVILKSEPFFLYLPNACLHMGELLETSLRKVIESLPTDTSTLNTKMSGDLKKKEKYEKNSLRNTNPYLKNQSDIELRGSIEKSAESSTQIEKDT